MYSDKSYLVVIIVINRKLLYSLHNLFWYRLRWKQLQLEPWTRPKGRRPGRTGFRERFLTTECARPFARGPQIDKVSTVRVPLKPVVPSPASWPPLSPPACLSLIGCTVPYIKVGIAVLEKLVRPRNIPPSRFASAKPVWCTSSRLCGMGTIGGGGGGVSRSYRRGGMDCGCKSTSCLSGQSCCDSRHLESSPDGNEPARVADIHSTQKKKRRGTFFITAHTKVPTRYAGPAVADRWPACCWCSRPSGLTACPRPNSPDSSRATSSWYLPPGDGTLAACLPDVGRPSHDMSLTI